MKYIVPFCLLIIAFGCQNPTPEKNSTHETQDTIRISDRLLLLPISDQVMVHVSYLETEKYGFVACNGLIYTHQKEAFIFDTPTRNEDSEQLINWLKKDGVSVKGVVINHSHIDCLGGLQAFHDRSIPSYAHQKTLELAQKDSVVVPLNGFEGEQVLKLGNQKVVNTFFGGAHTHDNIISWLPNEKVIFGGCMVKSLKSGKGNLADADLAEWSSTIQKVKTAYPEAEIVIPGHGKFGNVDLLNYTIEMFAEKSE